MEGDENNRIKILLVDDRVENLLALEVILSTENIECVKANSGKEALKILLKDQAFAIILMDVQMPLMDGFETAELIRQSEKLKQVPIIFLTANMNTSEYIFRGYKAGAVDYMIKPLSPEILKAKIGIFADLYKKNRELLAQEDHLKTLNDRLQKQSQYVRSLIEASLDPLITISLGGKITDMNEALASITGLSRGQLIGTFFFDYFSNPRRAREVFEEVLDEGSITDSPLTICTKDGKFIEMLCNGSIYRDESDRVVGVVIVAREKLLSKYSRSLIEASLDPLVTISAEGMITDMNQATLDITGMTREKIKDTHFFDYFTEQQKAREVYQEVFEKGFVIDSPLTLRHVEGKLTEVLFNGSVYKDEKGNVLGVVIVARDVTAQKKFANELLEAKNNAERERQIAERAVKSKQQFLANMSHEIRTPMNAIIGFTKVISKTDLNTKQKEYLDAIKISGNALIVLINDILDLAKVDAGKMTFNHLPFKLSDSVSAMLHLFETEIEEKNLKLIKEYDDSIPDVLIGDPVRLHQIILNLVSNAVKFTTEGKITVNVRMLKQDTEHVTVEFDVSDTGIGISDSKLETIFEGFQQASSDTSRIYGGTGLGLAIVKQLVVAQGGNVTVKSEVGKGSTFRFALNFGKTEAKVEGETDLGVDIKKAAMGIKILVVEDVELNQLLMKTVLEEFGFVPEIAENGKIAIDKLQKSAYDVILMDLQMPEMNGFEATEHIRKNLKSTTPIIALTADVTTVDVEKCRAAGMNDYISKPVDDKLLYRKIIKQLNLPLNGKTNKRKERKVLLRQQDKSINLDYLKVATRNNSVAIKEIIAVYLQETPKLIGLMKEAISSENWEQLQKTAHSLIPSFSAMGINAEFEKTARKMEAYAVSLRDKGLEEAAEKATRTEIKDLFLKIEIVCAQACEELKAESVVGK
jgi:PAS domain S-box-containing protein